MTTDFTSITEVAGDDVTAEQVDRLARRYYWAGEYCDNHDVVEVACGTGQGLGYLGSKAKSLIGADLSEPLLEIARRHYGDRFKLQRFDAQEMPFGDQTLDVVIICEALYYIPDIDRFFSECRRVLRAGGTLLIATANKDLFDFTPSPHSFHYFGVLELARELSRHGFESAFWGDTPVDSVSWRQRILRPVKALASKTGLIPKSMKGKKLLKRLVFGGLVRMPAEVTSGTTPPINPAPLSSERPDQSHKVIYCAATKRG